ncbi:SPOR domain-containing protein [Campylobacter sp. MG1]|uniref:SPOR domain-containing protein n=1 Tax=Campylobacter sp. MG1 TaxID=2976332 RepID=UPI00226C9C11|nr:SPOR domain-containing protein [Campylobacter sp. MG1]
MQEQKFEDLVIDNNSKKNKQKQIIFRFIVFLIFILVFGIIYKIIFGVSPDKELPVVDNIEKQPIKEEFEELKAKNNESFDDFNTTIQRLKNENSVVEMDEKKSQEVQNIVNEINTVNESIVEEPVKVVNEVKNAVNDEKKDKTPVKKVVEEKKSNVKKLKETSVFDTIDVVKPNNESKKIEKTNKPSTSSSGSYVQVYASKNIDLKSHEIKKLDSLGLQYKVVTDDKGMSRVIVGPYSNSEKANALKFIREKVRKDAFYYQAR